ncbi:hypothetical protein, partial [Pseudomonas sp. 2995-1]|uniref:hypothetical protein n=1 Tax=Pseudomonas sp. 2995-1 TaxID=1712679 RepID=UPI0013046DC3
ILAYVTTNLMEVKGFVRQTCIRYNGGRVEWIMGVISVFGKRTLPDLIDDLRRDEHVAHWHEIKEEPAKVAPFPEMMDIRIKE